MVVIDVAADEVVSVVGSLAVQPFDVTAEVPVRVRLYRVSDVEFVLAFVVHHISGDRSSMGPLTRDLMVAYAARVSGDAPGWRSLEVQYADFTLWQREVLGSEGDPSSVAHEQISFWKSELAGLPDQIDLPTDRPRPAVQSLAGGKVDFGVDAAVQSGLMRIARESNATLFMAVHAAWAALLSRLSGSSDVVVGSPIAGRGEAALDDVIGMFANTLVLRSVVDPASSFVELLDSVRESDLRAFAHADVPFERLVEVLNPARSTARHPLFQVALSFQNVQSTALELPSLSVAGVDADLNISQFDLHLVVSDTYDEDGAPAGLGMSLTYMSSLFDEASAVRMVDRFGVLLEEIVSDAGIAVGDYRILERGESEEISASSRVVEHDVPEKLMLDHFTDRVSESADSLAVVFEGIELSYGEFDARVNRLARHLIGQGVGPETVVGLSIRRSVDLVVAMYAVVRAGGAYLPLDPDHPAERTSYILETARPLCVLRASADDVLVDFEGAVFDLDVLDLSGLSDLPIAPGELNAVVRPFNTAYVLFTSGSTGRPKGVAVSHRAIVNQLEWMSDRYEFTSADVYLQKTATTFDVSLWGYFLPLRAGATLVLATADGHRDPVQLAHLIHERQVTLTDFVPSMLTVFGSLARAEQIRSLRDVFVIGEALPLETVEDFRKISDARIHNLYGPTEAAVSVTSWEASVDDRGSVPIGLPEWNVGLLVLDSRLHPVADGVPGELYLLGSQLARGYVSRPDLTAGRFVASATGSGASMYRTGDLVRRRKDGVLEYIGRTDFQVKFRGQRIELGEIESALLGHRTVIQAVVVVASSPTGDRLVAYVVPAPGEVPTRTEVLGHVSATLPSYMVPSAFVVLDQLPLNPAGKLDRRALPEPEFEPRVFRAPSSPVEEAVAGVFADVLGVSQVGLDDDFFELGGNSLVATQVVARLRADLDTEVPLMSLFSDSTVERLASRIAASSTQNVGSRNALDVVLPIRDARSGPRLWCIHPMAGLSWVFANLATHLDSEVAITTLQSPALTEEDWNPTSIDEWAARYVREMQRVQPEGPYMLLGWSLGGVLAHAAAVQLQGKGNEVSVLAMMDSTLETSPGEDADSVATNVGLALTDLFAGLLPGHVEPGTTMSIQDIADVLATMPEPFSGISADRLASLVDSSIRSTTLINEYEPAVFLGDLVYFAAGADDPTGDGRSSDWDGHVSGTTSNHVIDSSHGEMASPENLKEIAAVLNRTLRDRVVRPSRSTPVA
ncbi:non-ribosomal peptide synthetase [Rhodococcus sp. P1Y]|uniref:non-ribosomal peptide synthetase n=1 Tax=Rhodococcus sp. P1Y TaxID=1302308 RepID=UPI001293BCAD|nr:non-ribosomal peptide synthetase [Rhodococcus sp. P1Y]